MEIKGENLKTVKTALSYGLMFSTDESLDARFALLLVDVEGALLREELEEQKKRENG
jgi:hypothetical protein